MAAGAAVTCRAAAATASISPSSSLGMPQQAGWSHLVLTPLWPARGAAAPISVLLKFTKQVAVEHALRLPNAGAAS